MIDNAPAKTVSKSRRFRKDTSGIAAVEFGLLAPILMIMLFGALEISRAVLMHKRFQRATAMVGDLIAREQAIGQTTVAQANAALAGIVLAAQHVMQPHNTTSLEMRVFSIRQPSNNGATKVEWEYNSKTNSSSSTCANKAMPASNMITAGNTAILVESKFSYTPLFASLTSWSSTQSLEWSDTITHSPRRGSCVEYAGHKCGELCP